MDNEITSLRAEVEALRELCNQAVARSETLLYAFRELSARTARDAVSNREAIIESKIGLTAADPEVDPFNIGIQSAQEDVIGGGGDAENLFSIRYRNGTAETPVVDIHRLEWIAKSSRFDPAKLTAAGLTEAQAKAITDYPTRKALMWDDALWEVVDGGDAISAEEPGA